ncbi:hypothetical protein HZC34_06045 [Candidatus Saganbacteria bacterium]|nr:hypothetical protein [Candidatus Saganbacteria bacterium]
MKKIIVLVIGLFILLSYCAVLAEAPAGIYNIKFSGSVWEMALNYPSDWELKDNPPIARFISPKKKMVQVTWGTYAAPPSSYAGPIKSKKMAMNGWKGTMYLNFSPEGSRDKVNKLYIKLPDKKYTVCILGIGPEFDEVVKSVRLSK